MAQLKHMKQTKIGTKSKTILKLTINESLRVSDVKRGENAGDIRMPRRGAWATEGNDDYSSPHPLQGL